MPRASARLLSPESRWNGLGTHYEGSRATNHLACEVWRAKIAKVVCANLDLDEGRRPFWVLRWDENTDTLRTLCTKMQQMPFLSFQQTFCFLGEKWRALRDSNSRPSGS